MIRQILWMLMPARIKVAHLRKRGMKIGNGCQILNGFDFGSEPYLISIGDNVRIASGVKIMTHDGGSGCSGTYIPFYPILIASEA